MDAGFLDMLHDAGDDDVGAVADRVDIDLDRVAQILVDQHRAVAGHLHRGVDIIVELGGPVDDLHRPAAEHVGGPGQHRIADPLGDRDRLVAAAGDAVQRLPEVEPVDQIGEALAILGEVDRVGRGAEDRDALVLERLGELQRRLPAELDDDAMERAVRRLDMEDFEHVLDRQRLEIEAVGGVVIGRHRLRIAIDHDRLIAGLLQRISGVDAAIVELDPLPDPVRPAAQDHDLLRVGRLALVLGLAEARRLVGRIHIGRLRLELGGAGVDPLEHRADAELVAQAAHLVLGGRADHRLDRVVEQAVRARPRLDAAAGDIGRLEVELGQPPVGKAHRLQPPEARGVARQAVAADRFLLLDDLRDPLEEPGIVSGDRVDLRDAQPLAQRLGGDEQPVRARHGERRLDLLPRRAVERRARRRGRSGRSRGRAAPFAGSRGSCGRSPSPRRPTSSRSTGSRRSP